MPTVSEIDPSEELDGLIEEIDLRHVVLEFSFYQSDTPSDYDSHFCAAKLFLDACHVNHLKHYATIDFEKYPLAKNHVYKWNVDELLGKPITFADFWGTDDVEPTPLGENGWSIPNVDGYKTAFFLPPYGLQKPMEDNVVLFNRLNDWIFGDSPREQLLIYSWSNKCSGYFDAGLEWWGAFMWTIARPDSTTINLVAASSSD